jgi:uncharacterized protein YhaN
MSHASDRAKLKEAKKVKRNEKKVKRNENVKGFLANFTKHTYRILVLVLAGSLMFAGVMSLVQADPIIRYTIAAVVVFFVSKEIW